MDDKALDDIVSSAPSEEEARRYRGIAKNWLPLPDSIKRVRLRFGHDHDGDPAVWIILYIIDDLSKTDTEIAEISSYGDRFRDDVIQADTGRWPFVRMEEEANA